MKSPGPEAMHTLFVGDFNFTSDEVRQALCDAGAAVQPCPVDCDNQVNEYVTNISPDNVPDGFGGGPLAAKRIDHVLEANPTAGCVLLAAEELLEGLAREVAVLACSGRGEGGVPAREGQPSLWESDRSIARAEVSSWEAAPPFETQQDGDDDVVFEAEIGGADATQHHQPAEPEERSALMFSDEERVQARAVTALYGASNGRAPSDEERAAAVLQKTERAALCVQLRQARGGEPTRKELGDKHLLALVLASEGN